MRAIDAELERCRISNILKEQNQSAYAKIFSANDFIKLLNNAPTIIDGKVDEAKYSHERYTFIKPIAHHYEEKGEQPYIKYGCPVCESLNNKHQVSVGEKQCPLCNVNFTWEENL